MKISEIEKDENATTYHTAVLYIGLSHPAFPSICTKLLLCKTIYTLIVVKGRIRFSKMRIFNY
ncbi:hypothetical protein [Candidatus Nitrosotenuis sp. DW1]|uniref:hypothetical protein n=1 Tax=Candidatus Nitrosotenuis sp. DW1 TaxID=2259672 RepID=UPI0015CEE3E8|nr:hypothetical protein [Candidatus Nitrosotenuis sp. DW1]